MLRLVIRNQLKHGLRSLCTIGAVAVAMFLLCVLRSLVSTLDSAVQASASNRVIVQSAVSLFVSLPESYYSKIVAVEGVEKLTHWNWFGGKYPNEQQPLNQFGVRMETFLDVYDEIEFIDGSREAFERGGNACIIGKDLAAKYTYGIGDRIPIESELYTRTDGNVWEFDVAGIYESKTSNVDNMTLFFPYNYLDEARDAGLVQGPTGISIYVARVAPGYDPVTIMAAIDEIYENGPQRVQSSSEATFQAMFVSMVGNIPLLVNSIGLGVLAAVLMATLNTMLMAAREQIHDMGILKALGFSDGHLSMLMMGQSLLLAIAGGLLGVGAALLAGPFIAYSLGTNFPGYEIHQTSINLALGLSLALGIVAGILPAWRARSLAVVDALSARA